MSRWAGAFILIAGLWVLSALGSGCGNPIETNPVGPDIPTPTPSSTSDLTTPTPTFTPSLTPMVPISPTPTRTP